MGVPSSFLGSKLLEACTMDRSIKDSILHFGVQLCLKKDKETKRKQTKVVMPPHVESNIIVILSYYIIVFFVSISLWLK